MTPKALKRAQEMYEFYLTNKSISEVGEKFDVSKQRVSQLFKNAGFEMRTWTKGDKFLNSYKNRPKKLIPRVILERLYLDENHSLRYIRKKLKTSNPTIYHSLDTYGIKRRTSEEAVNLTRKYPKTDAEMLKKLYIDKNLTADEIACRLNFSPATVRIRLLRFGIKKRAGSKN